MSLKPKILFIGDSLASLKLASDTSIAFCEAALNLDFEVFWCEKKDISYFNYEILVNRASVITKAYLSSRGLAAGSSLDPVAKPRGDKCLTAGSSLDPVVKPRGDKCLTTGSILFSEFTYCFIRPDPPFDESYKDLCWLLNTQTNVKMYNPPSALLNFHEKSFQLRAFSEGVVEETNLVPTCVSESIEIVKEFINFQIKNGTKKFITKPWLGHGGVDVTLWHDTGDLIRHVLNSKHTLIVQPFLDEIHTVGDRRVMIVNGNVAWSFVRIPPKEGIASNLARGGSALMRDMTPAQQSLCQKLGAFLLKHSISVAGIDLIGEKIGEINITSPTGFRAYEKLTRTKVIQKAFEDIIYFGNLSD